MKGFVDYEMNAVDKTSLLTAAVVGRTGVDEGPMRGHLSSRPVTVDQITSKWRQTVDDVVRVVTENG